jgi:hypothetical protein
MNYEKDPVVEEIRETRRKLLARIGNDPHKFGKFLQAESAKRKARMVKKAKVHTTA